MDKSLQLYHSPPVAHPPSGWLRALVRQVGSRFVLWIARSGQRRELYELDDRLLRDIGISREQAIAEAKKPFWR